MAGIRISLGYNPAHHRLHGKGTPSSNGFLEFTSKISAGRDKCMQECRCSLREPDSGANAVLRQIAEIEAGLSELSKSRIVGQNEADRVARLSNRLHLLNKGVERATNAGETIPAQLIAALNALQRDQSSLTKIVHLANLPALVPVDDKSNPSVDGEKVMNSLKRESSLAPAKQAFYKMSSQGTQGPTMASLRAEIERRVIRQLTGERSGDKQSDQAEVDETLKIEAKRAELAEQQLRKLELQLGRTIPVDVHETLVETLQESLRETQQTVQELTQELAEKDEVLKAVKKDFVKEQGEFLSKVSVLRGEISQRASSMEELQATVNLVVEEFSQGLQVIQKKTEVLCAELEAKEKLLTQMKKDWKTETKTLRKKLAKSRKQVEELEQARRLEHQELAEAKCKVSLLEAELSTIRREFEKAEENRTRQQQESLAKMKTLITEMVKISRAKSDEVNNLVKSETKQPELRDDVTNLVTKSETKQPELLATRVQLPAETKQPELLGTRVQLPTEQNLKKLQGFFSVMKDLLWRSPSNN